MAVSSNCLCHHQFPLKINLLTPAAVHLKSTFPPKVLSTEFYGTHIGSRATLITNSRSSNRCRKILRVHASWFESVGLAGHAFTVGTAAVLPFYILMVAAPKAELTKRCMRSSIPYVILGVFYFYLLYLSWTPDTVRLVFASKYLLPELPSVAKMFSNDMTLASAWIHLLAIDLFAARQVYHDGLENKIETRHSVSLCLLSCPIGILVHAITKAITKTSRESKSKIQ